MHPLAQLALTLLLALIFIGGLIFLLDWKIRGLVDSLANLIKLEIKDPVGHVSLVGTIVIAILFLTLTITGEGAEFVGAFNPQLTSHSLDATLGFLIVAFVFIGNLVVLALLTKTRQPEMPKEVQEPPKELPRKISVSNSVSSKEQRPS